MTRADYRAAIAQSGVLARLAAFDPHVAGTPPLALDLPESDIDILCYAPDLEAFAVEVQTAFEAEAGFALRRWREGSAVIATFKALGWDFEIFAQQIPVAQQQGWRHFVVERRLLAVGGAPFHAAVMQLRRDGLKTEPAFAAAQRLPGNPYAAVLALAGAEPAALIAAGFAIHGSA
ncbi:DUF4269 domain-containing protein [Sphingomonas sp. MMS12-HWE2-04]|uniref:DUF4269 domain-containing protein n=1 Tax=Sphingomonas sp. MMS12-HWE2-04 TaxID=3234199 RepID=UPI00384CA978